MGLQDNSQEQSGLQKTTGKPSIGSIGSSSEISGGSGDQSLNRSQHFEGILPPNSLFGNSPNLSVAKSRLVPDTWFGHYYDNNGWGGDVWLKNISVQNNDISGDALILIRGTDLGWKGLLKGTIDGSEVNLLIAAGPPPVLINLIGYWCDVASDSKYSDCAMFGVLPPVQVPILFHNESAGGVWELWPAEFQCQLPPPIFF
jgi:hypothetical protein